MGQSVEQALEQYDFRVDQAVTDIGSPCVIKLIENNQHRSYLDGTYSSKLNGNIIIKNGYIKIGLLKRVKYSYHKGTIYFEYFEISNILEKGYANVLLNKEHNVIGLNTYIDCNYELYQKI